MPRAWKTLPLYLVLPLAMAACGTTVPLTSQAPGADTGLVVPSRAPLTSNGPQAPVDQLPGVDLGTGTAGRRPLSGSPTSPEVAEPVPSTGPVGGAAPSRNTAPLKIGVIYLTDGGAAQSLGLNQGTSEFTPEQVARNLVKGFNALGGLSGRRLDATYAGWSTSSNDYNTDAAALCQKFSRDTPVPVVVDIGVGNLGGLPECLARAGIVHLSTGFETDQQGLRGLPLHVNTAFLALDRAYLNTLERLASVGYLTRTSKLGVVREQCADAVRAYDDVVLPRIKQQLGQTPMLVTTRCSNGISGASSAGADISNAVLRFSGAGIDRVMFVSRYESIVLVLFSNAAESQGYRPGYALSSYAGAAPLAASLRPAQQPGLHGGGWRPSLDTSTTAFSSPSERQCLAVFARSGSKATLPNDQGSVAVSCAPFLVLQRLLELTSGSADRDRVAGAIAQFGSGTELPALLEGAATLSTSRRDMPAAGRAFGYVTSCTCLRYEGSTSAIS